MSKRLNNMKWDNVALEGFPVSMSEKFQGFVGLEECTSYSLDKESKRSKKKKQNETKKDKKRKIDQETKNDKKRKIEQATVQKEVPNKKVKLSNGFVVESCVSTTPSLTNTINSKKNKKTKQKNNTKISNIEQAEKAKPEKVNNKKVKNNSTVKKEIAPKVEKKQKVKLGDLPQSDTILTPEDMLTWAEFKLQEPIIKALTELGYQKPTKIQQLSLPAAIHGRRDILGAAETGSGKTLAFGLPIISGILKLKEKAELKGLDVYDIPYKKTSVKKTQPKEDSKDDKKKNRKDKKNKQKPKKVEKPKESSEDGYSSCDENEDDDGEEKDEPNKEYNDEDYLEEIEVPIKKRNDVEEEDEGNDSDDNYIHLSDMLDSDDLAESDDAAESDEAAESDDGAQSGNESKDSGEEADMSAEGDDIVGDEESNGEENDDLDEVDENQQGIGCVKVVDNIEIPGFDVTRTGKPLYALIITPTRELAVQISRHLISVAKYTGIKVATIVGGMAAVKQERVLKSGPEIVVATPGRLWELINQGQAHLQQLDTVKFLAIDETDRMIERGHFEELTPLLERLNADEARAASRQNFVFSATLTLLHDLPKHVTGKKVTKRGKIINRKVDKMTVQQKINRLIKMVAMTDPKVVDITAQNLGTAETLTESRLACALEHKDAYLYYVIKRHPGRTIVFCNSIGSVRRLAQLFTILKCHPLPLHASMPQRQRLKNLERFRDDPHGVLIATDVAARGLDIPHVEHVIHYQVPRTAENYVHRSGRTARAMLEGLTILMMEPTEAYLYSKLCRTLNKTTELPTFPVDPQILSPMKELVVLARELDALELKKRRTAQAIGWKERAAREMDIIIDDDDVPTKEVDTTIDKALKAKRRRLEQLLSRPVYPKGFSFKYPTLNDPNALRMPEENALQVMKKAIESGQLKKEKRKSKNAPLLQLGKKFKKKK